MTPAGRKQRSHDEDYAFAVIGVIGGALLRCRAPASSVGYRTSDFCAQCAAAPKFYVSVTTVDGSQSDMALSLLSSTTFGAFWLRPGIAGKDKTGEPPNDVVRSDESPPKTVDDTLVSSTKETGDSVSTAVQPDLLLIENGKTASL